MADTKNAFDALKKGASWNTASRDALVKIEDKDGRAKKAKDIIGKIKDPKRKRAIESAYNETLTDIKSTVKLGKEPKREDFLNAIKKADNISKVLNDCLIDMGWDLEKNKLKITGMWSIINPKNATNSRHIHSNKFIIPLELMK